MIILYVEKSLLVLMVATFFSKYLKRHREASHVVRNVVCKIIYAKTISFTF